METLTINYGEELGIYSKKMNGFLRYDLETRKIKADSIHPFLKTTGQDGTGVSLEEFRIFSEKDPAARGNITFGSHIYIININGSYLTVDDQGNLNGVKIPETNNPTYLRYSTWSIVNKDNQSSRSPVLITDTILLKSSLGNYLRLEEYGSLKSDGATPNEKTFWNVCRARVPFIPNWARIKPYVSAAYLIPSLNSTKPSDESPAKRVRDPRLESTGSQEKVLIQELLYVLLSIEGKYIKRKEDTVNNRYYYAIEKDTQLDSSLVLMVSNILPLCEHHDRVLIFSHKYSTFDGGVVFQALANAVKTIRRDYVVAINALDQEFNKGHFTLQRMWYETQKPNKIFEYLCKILNDIEMNVHESPLTILYKHLLISTDEEIHHLVYYLLQQSIYPYLEMLGKWIYYGIIDDKFGEFMVREVNNSITDYRGEPNDWLGRFALNPSKVPQFLQPVADRILATGKYLNVIKNYDKSSQCPYSCDLIENHETYLQQQDFSACIDKAFEWANKELIRIILDEKKFIDRLVSLKQYFFLEADSAESELVKEAKLISQEKLQSLLEMSIRTSSAETDPFKDDVVCYLANSPFSNILSQFQSLQKKEIHKLEQMLRYDVGYEARARVTKGIKGYELFTLGYNVEWPLNLILTETNLILYRLVFKNLFLLRYTEQQLYNCWSNNQEMKSNHIPQAGIAYFLLIQRMINFVRTVLYNFCNEVIEENWKTLMSNIQKKVKKFDDILNFHEEFINNCVRDTMLNDTTFSNMLLKILKVCSMATTASNNLPKRLIKMETEGYYGDTDYYGSEGGDRESRMNEEERSMMLSRIEDLKSSCKSMSNLFDTQIRRLLEYMNTEHHKFEQSFTNLYQNIDFYGYYTKGSFPDNNMSDK